MTNVPLANIQDEWSEFVDASKETNKSKDSLTNKLRSKVDNFKPNITLNNEENNLKNNESKNQKSKQSTDKFNFANHKLTNLADQNELDDEIEEEFSAFQQQFEQLIREPKLNDGTNDQKAPKVESLEELVSTFDEKIVNCFVNYEEPVELIMEPVQILNQDELLNECQMWLKITGNFSQILPVNWQSTYSLKYLLPYLIGNKDDSKKMEIKSANKNENSSLDKKNLSPKNNSIFDKDHNFNLDNSSSNLDSVFNNSDSTFDTNGFIDEDQFVFSSFIYDYTNFNPHQSSVNYSFTNYKFDRRSEFDDEEFMNESRKNRFSYSYLNEFESEYEEQLAKELDFHSLILCSIDKTASDSTEEGRLPFTAEEVLKELDIILQQDEFEDNLDTTSATLENTSNVNYYHKTYLNDLNETDELDNEIVKENILNSTINYNMNKLMRTTSLLKPSNTGGHHTNSIGTSFSSNSLDDVLSSGLSRSQTSSSQISSGIDACSNYPSKTQNEIENEKQLFEKQLRTLNLTQLNEVYLDLERMIQNHSEILISELALKDELEYEKELKNQFISLLICIQNKRKKQNLQKKASPKSPTSEQASKYLTTVIPYNSTLGPPDTRTLQVLIKILKAINENSPTVPTLLTDFILKILCPT